MLKRRKSAVIDSALTRRELLGTSPVLRQRRKVVKLTRHLVAKLGYLPVKQAGGALLFHLLSKLYEHTSVMITTNLDFAEWSGPACSATPR